MLRKDLGELKDESGIRIIKGEDDCSIPRKRLWPSLGGDSDKENTKTGARNILEVKHIGISEKLDGTSAEEKKRISVKLCV